MKCKGVNILWSLSSFNGAHLTYDLSSSDVSLRHDGMVEGKERKVKGECARIIPILRRRSVCAQVKQLTNDVLFMIHS